MSKFTKHILRIYHLAWLYHISSLSHIGIENIGLLDHTFLSQNFTLLKL